MPSVPWMYRSRHLRMDCGKQRKACDTTLQESSCRPPEFDLYVGLTYLNFDVGETGLRGSPLNSKTYPLLTSEDTELSGRDEIRGGKSVVRIGMPDAEPQKSWNP